MASGSSDGFAQNIRLGHVFRYAAAILTLAYLGLALILTLVQSHLIFRNATEHVAPAAAGLGEMREETIVTGDGERLIAWWSPPRGHGLVVLDLQGQTGGPAWRTDRIGTFVRAGYGIMTLAYRGYGGSTGSPSEAGLYEDAASAYRWLRAQGFGPEQIVIFGESLGTGVAVNVASSEKIAGLVLDSPFTSVTDVVQGRFPHMPVWLLLQHRFDSLSRIGRVTAPLLVLHGDQDDIVPFALGKRLFAAANEPKRHVVFPDGGHLVPFDKGPWREIASFLGAIEQQGAREHAANR